MHFLAVGRYWVIGGQHSLSICLRIRGHLIIEEHYKRDHLHHRCKHVLTRILLIDTTLNYCKAAAGANQRSQHSTKKQAIVDVVESSNAICQK